MSHTRSPTKIDWVSSRLDEIRGEAFKHCQSEKESLIAVRKASFGLMESKHSVAHKKKLYRIFDSIMDTIWLRFVFISSSKFMGLDHAKDPLAPAHGHLLLLSSIALEIRCGIFDLLDAMCRIKAATSGSSVGAVSTPEHTSKSLTKLYGLNTMTARLAELINEVKIKLSGARDKAAAVAPGAQLILPPQVESPIMLLEERLKHFSSLDREALWSVHPPLRDLRHSLAILYQLHCDDAAVGLALASELGEGYQRVLTSSASLRDDFAQPILEAFHCARANAWLALRDLHQLDLNTTAKASAPTPAASSASSGAAAAAAAAKMQSPSKHVYESASSADAEAAGSAAATTTAESPASATAATPATPASDASSPSASSPAASVSSPAPSTPAKPIFDSAPPPLLSATQTHSSSSYQTLSASKAAPAARSGSMVDSDVLPPPLLSTAVTAIPAPAAAATPAATVAVDVAPAVAAVPITASATLARRSLPPVPGVPGKSMAAAPAASPAAESSPSNARPLPAVPESATAAAASPSTSAAVAPAPAAPAPAAPAPAADDWVEVKDPAGGPSYYWNAKLAVSAWTKPAADAAAATAAP